LLRNCKTHTVKLIKSQRPVAILRQAAVKGGKIVSFGKIRGRKKTIEALAQKYDELVVEPENQVIGISHADCLEDAQKLIELINRNNPPREIMLVDHEPATGSYLGPGALALYFAGAEDVRYK